jgi:voltage-gated potassium channel
MDVGDDRDAHGGAKPYPGEGGVTRSTLRRVVFATVMAILLFVAGTVGFHHLLHESWNEAFYRTAITATLTGLDTAPRGTGAEYLTIAIALGGVAIFGYVAKQAFDAIANELGGDARKEKKQHHVIEQLENHFIICGYGRVGRRAADEFVASGQPFVVLDTGAEAIDVARQRGVLYLRGSGSDDGDLERVGIDRARGLLASADSDAENIYITLSARSQRPEGLMIVARASTRDAERKLVLAGADRVVQPYAAAGTEMAKLALKPQVAAFLELVSSHGGPDLRFEELEITAECPQAGRTIREIRIRSTTGAVVIALRKPDGTFDVTPDPDETIAVGDVVIAIGTEEELRALEELFGAGSSGS